MTLGTIIGSDNFNQVTDKICESFNILNVLNQILKMYFLDTDEIFDADLLQEVLFLANNFIAHEYHDHEQTSQFEKCL